MLLCYDDEGGGFGYHRKHTLYNTKSECKLHFINSAEGYFCIPLVEKTLHC